jgi:hypothetical protein
LRQPLGHRGTNTTASSRNQYRVHEFKETKRPGLRRAFPLFQSFRSALLTECSQELEQVSSRH